MICQIFKGVLAKKFTLWVDFSKTFDSLNWGKTEQILLAFGFPKETVKAKLKLYRDKQVNVHSPDRDTDVFDIVAAVLQKATAYLEHWSIK